MLNNIPPRVSQKKIPLRQYQIPCALDLIVKSIWSRALAQVLHSAISALPNCGYSHLR
jgi:hypothetical protein